MFLSKYGVARHIYIPIPKAGSANHAVSGDWTPAAGDVKISKDGGAAVNVTNLPTAIAMGNSTVWDFSLTATEMQAAQINVTVADSATKAVDDTGFIVETYGHASAQHEMDFDTPIATPLTAAQIANGVWTDTTAGDFTVAGSIGKSIMNGVALGTGLTIAAVSGAVGSVTALSAGAVASIWDALLSTISTASSIGKLLKDNIDATISSRMASYTQPTGFLTTDFTTLGSNASNAAGSSASAYLAALDAANFASTAATQAAAANTRVQLGVPAFAPGTGGGVLIAGTNAAFGVAGDVSISGDFDITGHLRPVGGFLGNQVGDFTGDFTGNLQTELTDLISTIGVSGAGLTDLGGMSSTMKGQVNTEADTALTDFRASALDETKVGNTVEAALVAALAQGKGDWAIVGNQLLLKNSSGATLYTFNLAPSAAAPTSRTRV